MSGGASTGSAVRDVTARDHPRSPSPSGVVPPVVGHEVSFSDIDKTRFFGYGKVSVR